MLKHAFLISLFTLVLACGGAAGDDDDDGPPSPNSVWRLEALNLQAPSTDPATGQAWDPFGGAPDPTLCIQVTNSGTPYCTSEAVDTFNAVWNETFPENYTHTQLASVIVEAYDVDVDPADFMGGTGGFISLQADLEGQAKTHELTGNGLTINIRVKP